MAIGSGIGRWSAVAFSAQPGTMSQTISPVCHVTSSSAVPSLDVLEAARFLVASRCVKLASGAERPTSSP